MDTVLAQSPLLPLKRSKKARTDNAASIFLLLRYLLIIAASYLFLFGAQSSASVLAGVMIATALLSNVIVSQFSEHRLMRPLSLAIILSFDIVWITFGLWYEGIFGGNMVVLYYLILFLAAVGQSLFLMIGASVALSAFDLCLFILSGGDWATVWTTQSLIRIPFMFIAALFYGYLMEKVGKEKKIGEERIQALREIEMAITSSLDLRAVLDVVLEKINVFLPYAVITVTLVNKKTGELEPMACRNLDETEWKEVIARRIRLDKISERDHAAVIILNAQTDPRSQQSEFLRKNGIVSYLRVPLAAKNKCRGF